MGLEMEGNDAACYLRIPFELTEIPEFADLVLSVAYRDGFVAYLNGVEVARRNAPETGRFTPMARPEGAEREFESIDLVEQRGLLKRGKNVLAFAGFKASADVKGFVLAARLTGFSKLSGSTRLFSKDGNSGGASPGAPNGESPTAGKIGPLRFSALRGSYSVPFDLVLGSEVQGVKIRYTLDGSTPSATKGFEYKDPIRISKTTVLRTLAFKAGYEAGKVETQTYLFPEDILRQSPSGQAPGPNWPTGNMNGQVFDYGMDPRIVNHVNPQIGGRWQVLEALADLPSISIVTDLKNLFDPATGIWVNTWGRGETWERPASVELIGDPETKAGGFQIDCGLRVRGGFSRSGDNPKHALRLNFRGDYDGELRYPLFGGKGAESFEKLDFRTAQNYSWSFSGDANNTFIREETSRELQGAMGSPHSRVRYFHLFINGQYWGIYDTDERPGASFAASYMGGRDSDYDVVKADQAADYTTVALDGNLDAWRELWSKTKVHAANPTNANFFSILGLSADGVTPSGEAELLDLDNFIDYLLLNSWMGNFDGCTSRFLGEQKANNWAGFRDRTGKKGFRFLMHDVEHCMFDVWDDRTGPFYPPDDAPKPTTYDRLEYANPMFMHMDLLANLEYRTRWADRVFEHMFNDGALTQESVLRVMRRLASQLDKAIIAESARWGDSKRRRDEAPLTRLDWIQAKNFLLNDYVPHRGDIVLEQLKKDGLYPGVDAPSVNHRGGVISRGSAIALSAKTGVVLYTLDGTDPRLVGGSVSNSAQTFLGGSSTDTLISLGGSWRYLANGSNQGSAWRAPEFDDTPWPIGKAELGYGDVDEATTVPYIDIDPQAPGNQRNATTYFRQSFSLSGKADVVSAKISVRYDDAVAVYLNGEEVVRTQNLPPNPSFDQFATSQVPDENRFYEFEIPVQFFREGNNVLAAEVHQVSPESSDISFDLSLVASKISGSSKLILGTAGSVKLRARARDGENWSALLAVDYDVRDLPNLEVFAAPVGDFVQGGTGAMTVVVTNNGNQTSAGKIDLEAKLPPELIANGLSGDGWQITSGTGRAVSATFGGSLGLGGSTPPLSVVVGVGSSAARSISCPFKVSGGGDLTPADNSTVAVLTVQQVGAGVISLSASDYTVNHEDGAIWLKVVRTGNSSGKASVRLRTKAGTAKPESDFVAKDVVVEFAEGETAQDVAIEVRGNVASEGNEWFSVELLQVSGAVAGAPMSAGIHILASDEQAPTLQLSSPKEGQVLRGAFLSVNGVAQDNREVARVEVKLNGKKYVDAAITATARGVSFQADLPAKFGANTVEVRCFDYRGNESAHEIRKFQFVPLQPLAMQVSSFNGGSVSLSPRENPASLEVGKVYALNAVPKPGMLFAGWTVKGFKPATPFANPLVFVMQKGVEATANFVESPWVVGVAGDYAGLIRPLEGVAAANGNHGFLNLTITGAGAFSGNLKIDGDSLPIRGAFLLSGTAWFGESKSEVLNIPRLNRPDLVLGLRADLSVGGSPRVIGTLGLEQRSGVTGMCAMTLRRSFYDGKTPGTSAVAKDLKIILDKPAAVEGVKLPSGEGTGRLTVTKTGLATLGVTLADGTKASAAAPLFADESFAAYMSLYSNGKGSLSGAISSKGATDFSGVLAPEMAWFRPYLSAGGAYLFGWEGGIKVPLRKAPGGAAK